MSVCMDRDGNRSRPSAQKGVLLVFTALLLPVVFACAGLAVDLGNMYVHKSNLQNAVDSAALAGAAGRRFPGRPIIVLRLPRNHRFIL